MKKIIACVAFGLAAFVANAGVMYWQVEDTGGTYDSACLVGVNGDTRVLIADDDGYYVQDARAGYVAPTTSADLSAYSGYTFYIELGSYAVGATTSDITAWTGTKQALIGTYSDLVAAGTISSAFSPGGTGSSMASKTAENFGPVPEPGTATLILLGMAIAGLKRRRV